MIIAAVRINIAVHEGRPTAALNRDRLYMSKAVISAALITSSHMPAPHLAWVLKWKKRRKTKTAKVMPAAMPSRSTADAGASTPIVSRKYQRIHHQSERPHKRARHR